MTAPRIGNLEVRLVSATHLRNVEILGLKQDPYCVLSCDATRSRSTTHTDGGKHPVWNQSFNFNGVSDASILTIEVYDENLFMRDAKIGVCKVPLKKAAQLGYEHVQTPVYVDGREKRGHVSLELKFRAASAGQAIPRQTTQGNRITDSTEKASITELYEFGPLLGQGTYGKIHKIAHRKSGQALACKSISKRRLSTALDRLAVQREVSILQALSAHPSVVHIKEVFEDQAHVYIVMELCTGGELFDRICDLGTFTEKDAARVMRTVLEVVAHCHDKGVIHRDLKPENLLLVTATHESPIKVADFGESTFFKPGEPLFDVVGSPQYVAPEVLRKKYGREADVWSCGIILYVLLSGQYPFPGKTDRQVFEAILRHEINFTKPPWPSLSDAAKHCVRRILVRDPRSRPSARELLRHEWIRVGGAALDVPIGSDVLQRLKNFSAADRLRREAQVVIARKLPAEQIAALDAQFRQIDSDGNGSISIQELRKALTGLSMQEVELQEIVANADVNGDGTLDYTEFIAATMQLEKLHREEQIREAFEHFDYNGDGFISREELMLALKDLPLAQANEILERVDSDGDGAIDYREFVAMMVGVA